MKKSFTLIELIVVIAIIAILAAIIAPNAFKAIEKAKISEVIGDVKAMGSATLTYYADMGFFPPDVVKDVDPGFVKPLPYSAINGSGMESTSAATTHPSNWKDMVNASWDGPYLDTYPAACPWGDGYDYDYWPNGRHNLGPGVYIGLRGLPNTIVNKLNNQSIFAPLSAGFTDSTEYLVSSL
ncbi:MAG: prepilin-type N-terminal cleavage/methylation domain-containing protein [Candidatus Omnitrophica bacterium]|nr:prepilin-type N-terminal cleavage/methylation domain-containing protein [Candidatus Omnitrophota bacterium]MBU2474055.1 prepilin-type N-terminal cleavage/methylation domain-containing protein [Candidatus Omnitrophota bacterium]